ncbi:MAG: hypothetical protein RJB38_1089 [Pseudomonadota bacterium]
MLSVAPILSLDSSHSTPDPESSFQEKLGRLQAITGVSKGPPQSRESLFWQHAQAPVLRGTLTEVSGPWGSGKTEAVLQFLGNHAKALGRMAWIEDRFTAYPNGFLQSGVDLSRILFIEGGKQTLWAAHQVLRSQIFGAVILFMQESTLSTREPSIELRRLQLSAEQSHACVFLLTTQPRPAGVNWPLALQLQMNPRTRKPETLKRSLVS